MKARIKFMKMCRNLPEPARTELVYGYPEHPMTLSVAFFEVKNNTDKGKEILRNLGYEDD